MFYVKQQTGTDAERSQETDTGPGVHCGVTELHIPCRSARARGALFESRVVVVVGIFCLVETSTAALRCAFVCARACLSDE